MPRKRRMPKTRRRRDVLTMAERHELAWGCFAPPRCFVDEGDRADNWAFHRAALLAECRAGHRPSAFWKYDVQPEDRPHGGESEVECLIRIKQASPADVAFLDQVGVAVARDPRAVLRGL
jgi:hypothetical protein